MTIQAKNKIVQYNVVKLHDVDNDTFYTLGREKTSFEAVLKIIARNVNNNTVAENIPQQISVFVTAYHDSECIPDDFDYTLYDNEGDIILDENLDYDFDELYDRCYEFTQVQRRLEYKISTNIMQFMSDNLLMRELSFDSRQVFINRHIEKYSKINTKVPIGSTPRK